MLCCVCDACVVVVGNWAIGAGAEIRLRVGFTLRYDAGGGSAVGGDAGAGWGG